MRRRFLLKHPLTISAVLFFAAGGGSLTIIGIITLLIPHEDARTASIVTFSQILVFAVLSAVFLFIGSRGASRLRRLKETGTRYDAEITTIVPSMHIHIAFYVTIHAECLYINRNQQRCMVKSPLFLWKNLEKDGLKASVYVGDNPRDYAVEITENEEMNANANFDIDYR